MVFQRPTEWLILKVWNKQVFIPLQRFPLTVDGLADVLTVGQSRCASRRGETPAKWEPTVGRRLGLQLACFGWRGSSIG